MAKALRRPVAVACTSGTAAAELFPAVVEASQARVPLYLLTADRPPRLRGTGANQTIDQVRLYGTYPRAYFIAAGARRLRRTRSSGGGSDARRLRPAAARSRDRCTSTARSRSRWCRPVTSSTCRSATPRAWSVPDRNPEPLAADVDRAARELSGARGVVVAGSNWWMASSEVAQLAQRLGWPLLAEPTSGLRQPGWGALAAGQSLIASTAFLERHRPELVLQVGATPTTRASQAFVAAAERLLVVDLFHPDPDPERQATWRLAANPDRLATRLMERRVEPAPGGWLASWRDADERARRAIDDVLDATDEPTELRLARDLAAAVPEGGTLFVGNSTPIRDLDVAMAPRDGLQVLANRGASGIDGLVSTALGIATAGTGPTVALIGDLSLLYDAGALLWNGQRLPADLVLVVPNNRGGAIFGSLDQRDLPERDRLFVTPQDVDLAALSAAAGVGHARLERMSDLANAVGEAQAAGGIQVIEVPTPAERSRRQRIDVRTAVDAALAGH